MGDEAEVRVMLLQAKVTQITNRPKPLEAGEMWCLGQTLPPRLRRNPPCPHLDLELLASRLRGNKSQLLSPP